MTVIVHSAFFFLALPFGRLAQRLEHLVYTQGVGGSKPSAPNDVTRFAESLLRLPVRFGWYLPLVLVRFDCTLDDGDVVVLRSYLVNTSLVSDPLAGRAYGLARQGFDRLELRGGAIPLVSPPH